MDPEADLGTIFDFLFEPKKGQWQPWVEAGVRTTIPKDASYNSVVVPTVDTVRKETTPNSPYSQLS